MEQEDLKAIQVIFYLIEDLLLARAGKRRRVGASAT